MAFSMTVRLLMKAVSSKSELISQSILKKNSIAILANQYIQALKNQKSYLEAFELVRFPFRTFHIFPKSVLKNIIDETFNLMKEQEKCKSADIYNNVMYSYMRNKINFNINDLLYEMTKYQIKFNLETYSNIIRYFCDRGEMVNLEYVLEKMKSENMPLLMKDKWRIIGGYIISGQPEKSKIFIIENELDENSSDILVAEARGYATIGDISSVSNILNKMEENKLTCSPLQYFTLYRLFIQAHVPESSLGKIFDLMKSVTVENKPELYKTILILNWDEHFHNSEYLVEKFIDIMDDTLAIDLIMTFNTPACPLDIYKRVLKHLMDRIVKVAANANIFSCMNFDDAFKFGKSEINKKNKQIICISFINKAISDKSMISIENSLQFFTQNLILEDINLILHKAFIKSMLESGMVSNCQEILDLFPKYKINFLSVMLMHHLCQGDFDEFNKLRMKYSNIKNVKFMSKWGYLSNEIMQNLSKNDINRFPLEALKFFSKNSINFLLVSLIKKKIIQSSNVGNIDEIKESVELAKNFNVMFSQAEFDYLIRAVPEHAELLNFLNPIPIKSRI